MMRWLPLGLGGATIACAVAVAVGFTQVAGTRACSPTAVPAGPSTTAPPHASV